MASCFEPCTQDRNHPPSDKDVTRESEVKVAVGWKRCAHINSFVNVYFVDICSEIFVFKYITCIYCGQVVSNVLNTIGYFFHVSN